MYTNRWSLDSKSVIQSTCEAVAVKSRAILGPNSYTPARTCHSSFYIPLLSSISTLSSQDQQTNSCRLCQKTKTSNQPHFYPTTPVRPPPPPLQRYPFPLLPTQPIHPNPLLSSFSTSISYLLSLLPVFPSRPHTHPESYLLTSQKPPPKPVLVDECPLVFFKDVLAGLWGGECSILYIPLQWSVLAPHTPRVS